MILKVLVTVKIRLRLSATGTDTKASTFAPERLNTKGEGETRRHSRREDNGRRLPVEMRDPDPR